MDSIESRVYRVHGQYIVQSIQSPGQYKSPEYTESMDSIESRVHRVQDSIESRVYSVHGLYRAQSIQRSWSV